MLSSLISLSLLLASISDATPMFANKQAPNSLKNNKAVKLQMPVTRQRLASSRVVVSSMDLSPRMNSLCGALSIDKKDPIPFDSCAGSLTATKKSKRPSLAEQVDMSVLFRETLTSLLTVTHLLADSTKLPQVFKQVTELHGSIRDYHTVLLHVRDTLIDSKFTPSAFKIKQFNEFLDIVHSTEILAIESEIKFLERAIKGDQTIDKHASMMIGSKMLAEGVQRHLNKLLD